MVLTVEINTVTGNQAHLCMGETSRHLVRFCVVKLALAAAHR
jgi:hypothetical protein